MKAPRFSTVALALMLIALSARAQSTTPALPRLATEAYPAAARDHIGRAYQKAETHPDDPAAVGALGRVLQAWGQWDASHQAYARAEALAPAAFEWRYLDGVVLQRLARHGEAAAQLAQAVAVSPTYLPARVKLAEALLEAGDLEQSGRLFGNLTREPAAEPAAQLGLGRIAALQGRHDAAIVHLQRAIALFPEFGAAYYALARSCRTLGRIEDARRALERHAEYGTRWPAIDDPVLAGVLALREDAAALLQRGVKSAAAGDVQAAIAAHEAALDRDPHLVQAHANLISLYGRAGNWQKAEGHYRAVVALGFNADEAHYDYGVLLGMQEKWDAAADAYRQAIAVNPLHVRARNNLGQILERQQKWEEAAAEYRRAIDTQPAFRLARFNLGRILIALGRPEDAIVEFGQLLQPRDAETPRYLFALATAHIRSGHVAEGVRWANEARALALTYGQQDLAAAIDRDLALIK
jgi:tetratricopeptide (TPR) repeat protein